MEFTDLEFEGFKSEVRRALKEVCDKYELNLTSMGIRYAEADFDLRLSFDKTDVDTERIKFMNDCEYYGYQKSDYKRQLWKDNMLYEFVGFKPKAKKYRCIIRNVVSGESIAITDEYLHRLFNSRQYKTSEEMDFSEIHSLTKEEIDFLKLKLGKSKRNEKDWSAIKAVLAGKYMFTYIPTNNNFMISHVNGMAVEAGYGMVFFDREELQKHVKRLTAMGLLGNTVPISAQTFEDFCVKSVECMLPIMFRVTAENNKSFYYYAPEREALGAMIM